MRGWVCGGYYFRGQEFTRKSENIFINDQGLYWAEMIWNLKCLMTRCPWLWVSHILDYMIYIYIYIYIGGNCSLYMNKNIITYAYKYMKPSVHILRTSSSLKSFYLWFQQVQFDSKHHASLIGHNNCTAVFLHADHPAQADRRTLTTCSHDNTSICDAYIHSNGQVNGKERLEKWDKWVVRGEMLLSIYLCIYLSISYIYIYLTSLLGS